MSSIEYSDDSDASVSSFIVEDSDYESSLIWDSEDSRPAGPSPPSSESMDVSQVYIAPRTRRARRFLRSDSENDTVETNSLQDSNISPTASVSIVEVLDTTDDIAIMEHLPMDNDSDATRLSGASAMTDGEISQPDSPNSRTESPPTVMMPPDIPQLLDYLVGGAVRPPSPPGSPPQFLGRLAPRSPSASPPASPPHPPLPAQGSQVLQNRPPPTFLGSLSTRSPFAAPLTSPPHPLPPAQGSQVLQNSTQRQFHGHLSPRSPSTSPPASPPHPNINGFVEVNEPTVPGVDPEPTKTTEPSSKLPIPTLEVSTLSDADESSLCTICMDPLTNSGKHRVVCLRCGHIFGHSCVERWIKVGCNNGAKRCPTCNKKACLKDIRVLYLPKVVPLDTIEKDRLVEDKEELMMQKKNCEMELAKCKLINTRNCMQYEEKISVLERKLSDTVTALEHLKQEKGLVSIPVINFKRESSKPELVKMIEVTKEGGCRVMAFNPSMKDLVISQPSGNTIFAGYGVRVLNSVDFTPGRFIFLHQKMIRDLCFHAEDRDLLLSASLDYTAKLLDIASSTTVHTFRVDGALWACCWDLSNPHLLFLGSQLGKVYQYDRRMMHHCVNLWDNNNNCTPVVALASAPAQASSPFTQGGFLSCRLNKAYAYSRHGEKYSCQELELEGPFMSMKYDPPTQTLLTASRPSSRCPYAKISHNLVDKNEQGNVCLPKIHTFNCGSSSRVMSRMTTMNTVNDSLVIAHHESGRSINMWSAKTGELVHSIPSKEPVIDFTTIGSMNNTLAALSEKKVCIYSVP